MKKMILIAMIMAMTSMMTGCMSDIQMPDFSGIFGGEETAEKPTQPTGKPQQKTASVEQKGTTITTGSEHGKGAKGYVAEPGEAVIIMGVSTKKDVAKELAGCERNAYMSFDMYHMLNKQSRVKKVTIIGKNGPVTLDAKRIQMLKLTYGKSMDVDAKKDLPVSQIHYMLM
jgi:hypothetical protein